jgi:excisionase family DNA binding protein
MKEEFSTSDPPGYLSVKQAAKILHVSERRVHQYIEAGRLPAYQPGRDMMLPIKEVEQFKPKLTGRPRQKTPGWRGSPDSTSLFITYIQVQIRPGRETELEEKLQAIKRGGRHLFPGTVMRYISLSGEPPPTATIQLVWRSLDTPDEATRKKAIEAFETELADVLDWKTAQYRTEKVAIHS